MCSELRQSSWKTIKVKTRKYFWESLANHNVFLIQALLLLMLFMTPAVENSTPAGKLIPVKTIIIHNSIWEKGFLNETDSYICCSKSWLRFGYMVLSLLAGPLFTSAGVQCPAVLRLAFGWWRKMYWQKEKCCSHIAKVFITLLNAKCSRTLRRWWLQCLGAGLFHHTGLLHFCSERWASVNWFRLIGGENSYIDQVFYLPPAPPEGHSKVALELLWRLLT